MQIAYLGAGTWGFALASLLGSQGHCVKLWSARPESLAVLEKSREHPKLPGYPADAHVEFIAELDEVLEGVEIIVESVSSKGVRPVFTLVEAKLKGREPPLIVLTSKGIEQNTGLLLPEVIEEVLGTPYHDRICCLSGPSHAEEVVQQLPTSVVCASYDLRTARQVVDLFTTPYFRVYPSSDVYGVAFGGAVKNIMAIACGISDGLGFGDNTKAALMTRGLHEIRKLAATKPCQVETLNGLAGLGDLCVTCLSTLSRNYQFGRRIAEGLNPVDALAKVGMVVEGAYTCVSALQLARKAKIDLPITEAVHAILYESLEPRDAVKSLLQRAIKEERL